jgi:signal transduction histidine kinase
MPGKIKIGKILDYKKLFYSIFFQIPFYLLLILAFYVVVTVISTRLAVSKQLENNMEEETFSILSSLEWAVSPLLIDNDMKSIQRMMENIGSYPFVKYLRLYDPQNRIMASSDVFEVGKINNEPVVSEILGQNKLRAFSMNYKSNDFKGAIPVTGGTYDNKRKSGISAVLFLVTDLEHQQGNYVVYTQSIIFRNIILFIVLSFFITLLLIYTVFKPLRKLMEAIQQISSGNYNYRIPITRKDEFSRFGILFNHMANKINKQNELLQGYSIDLEKKVYERTLSLERANQEVSEAYEKLKQIRSELIQSEKMASIGLLAAGIAHEINNPVSFIQSNLNTLKKYFIKLSGFIEEVSRVFPVEEPKSRMKIDYIDSDIKNLIEESIYGCSRINGIVKNLKDFSYMDKDDITEVDINELIDSVLKIIRNQIKDKITIEKKFSKTCVVKCNAREISQIFLNIIINSIHSIESNGMIRISTLQKKKLVIIKIEDNGCGIPQENISKIFNPFFTTKDPGKGTGLGLYIVYELIKKHGGVISVRSKVGRGTNFVISLPLSYNNMELKAGISKGDRDGNP